MRESVQEDLLLVVLGRGEGIGRYRQIGGVKGVVVVVASQWGRDG